MNSQQNPQKVAQTIKKYIQKPIEFDKSIKNSRKAIITNEACPC